VALIRGLSAHGVEVRGLAADLNEQGLRPPADLDVEVVPVPLHASASARLRRVTDPRGMLGRGAFAERLRALSSGVDLVHLDELDAAAGLRVVNRPAVVHLHFLAARDRTDRAPWRPEGRAYLELARAERRATRRARWVLANSPEVAGALRAQAPQAEVAVAPLALDPRYYEPAATLERPVIGLIGTAAWPPTAAATRRLVTAVWPRIHARRPDARLAIAGRGMHPSNFPGLGRAPGVEWRGEVRSATGFLRELAVMLFPLGHGSGAKVKVLESLALGVPVVTTPAGAEGISSREGMTVHATDEGLACATAALLDDPAARRAQGDAGRRSFARHHAPEPATAAVVELYRRMVR
jgi:glycosyltransferase involved in cell wall biosynthesis